MAMKIITNGQLRPIEYEIPMNEEDDIVSYVTYRGCKYYLCEFERAKVGGELANLGWSGYCSETAFSAVIIKLGSDGVHGIGSDYVLMGRYVQVD